MLHHMVAIHFIQLSSLRKVQHSFLFAFFSSITHLFLHLSPSFLAPFLTSILSSLTFRFHFLLCIAPFLCILLPPSFFFSSFFCSIHHLILSPPPPISSSAYFPNALLMSASITSYPASIFWTLPPIFYFTTLILSNLCLTLIAVMPSSPSSVLITPPTITFWPSHPSLHAFLPLLHRPVPCLHSTAFSSSCKRGRWWCKYTLSVGYACAQI